MTDESKEYPDLSTERTEAWLFARDILGRDPEPPSGKTAGSPPSREQLEWLAKISPRHADELRRLKSAEAAARRDRELLQWAAQISSHAQEKLHALEREEAAEGDSSAKAGECKDLGHDPTSGWLEEWDEADHPRDRIGRFRLKQGGIAGGAAPETVAQDQRLFQMAAVQQGQSGSVLAAPSITWPKNGPTSSWLPKVGSGGAAGAGAAGGIGAGAFLGGVRNASMGAYWSRTPSTQAMPQIWVYELEKRVRAGKLSREDAIGIFNTAVLGAEAQDFKPTGGTMSAAHKSATDFLGKAEQVYFARKKQEQSWSKQRGGYQQSGGRVFPTERNSGLRGEELRQEQEDFFERRLSDGVRPDELRGQAHEAGVERFKRDKLADAAAEAALQRAIRKVIKQSRTKK